MTSLPVKLDDYRVPPTQDDLSVLVNRNNQKLLQDALNSDKTTTITYPGVTMTITPPAPIYRPLAPYTPPEPEKTTLKDMYDAARGRFTEALVAAAMARTDVHDLASVRPKEPAKGEKAPALLPQIKNILDKADNAHWVAENDLDAAADAFALATVGLMTQVVALQQEIVQAPTTEIRRLFGKRLVSLLG